MFNVVSVLFLFLNFKQSTYLYLSFNQLTHSNLKCFIDFRFLCVSMSLVKLSIRREKLSVMEERVPLCKIYTNQINVFYYSVGHRSYPENQGLNLKEDRKKAYSGKLSESSKRIIKERLTAWYYITQSYNKLSTKIRGIGKRELIMVTLTLSSKQFHTDKFIKENLLELFLKRMRYNYDAQDYFWKAEKQANGNIHFHIWFDVYIDKRMVQEHWNEVQDKFDYLRDYYKKYGKMNPPSTQVEVITGKKSAIDYMMKYVSKTETDKPILGRVFSFSERLLNVVLPVVQVDSKIQYYMGLVKKKEGFNMVVDSYFSVLRWKCDASPINSNLEAFDFYHLFFSDLAVLFYVKNVSSDIIDKYVCLQCNFFDFKYDDTRYSYLLEVSKFIKLTHPI